MTIMIVDNVTTAPMKISIAFGGGGPGGMICAQILLSKLSGFVF